MAVNLNIYQTLAAAIVVYYTGVFLRAKFDVLRKYCIPAPVVGGILFAIINCILYTQGLWQYEQDTIMQNICMMLFFTSVGYTASISLIKRGGSWSLKWPSSRRSSSSAKTSSAQAWQRPLTQFPHGAGNGLDSHGRRSRHGSCLRSFAGKHRP